LAFGRFFKGISKRPKFKKRNKSVDSFYVGGDQIKIKNKSIWVPQLSWVRLKELLRFEGPIRSATFSRKADRWFVSLHVDTTIAPKSPSKKAVGVDLGINSLVHTSDGVSILSPKPLRKSLRALARASRRLSRKENGSKAKGKQRLKVQKIHVRITNIRKDALHKTSSYLTSQYKSIAIEDLNVSGMLKNHKLSRAISDLGFYELRRQLEYKAKMYGNTLVVADRFFPSSKKCSSCGSSKKELSLKERVYTCDCGISLDRDLNAALNLRNLIEYRAS
jgi:putative transposase